MMICVLTMVSLLWNIDLEIGLVNISIALLNRSPFTVNFINMLTNQLR